MNSYQEACAHRFIAEGDEITTCEKCDLPFEEFDTRMKREIEPAKGARSKEQVAQAVREAVQRTVAGPRTADGSPNAEARAVIEAVMAEVGPLVAERDRRIRELRTCQKSRNLLSRHYNELTRLNQGLTKLRRELADVPDTDWEALKKINDLWLNHQEGGS